MDIIYAAEKPSIAKLLSDHIHEPISPEDIDVVEDLNETGRFRINWQFKRYQLSPAGEIASD